MTRLVLIGVGMLSVAALAFAGGRLSKNSTAPRNPTSRVVPSSPTHDSKVPLDLPADVRNLAGMSFPEMFEALKMASPESLKTWAKELEEIKPSPTKCAAVTAFFKTLIQVNPPAAKKMILELQEDSRWAAMIAIKDAAPPRAMKEVVEVLLTYDLGEISSCSYNFLASAFDEWSRNDPVAVRQFLEEHPGQEMESYFGNLVRNWAAYDPESARSWMMQQFEARPPLLKWEEGESRTMEEGKWGYASEGMIRGWMEGFLENDREAALNYLLAHDDDQMAKALPLAVSALFLDSPEEARAFVLRLPEKRWALALDAIMADRAARENGDDRNRSPEFVANWMLQFPSDVWSENISMVLLEWRFKSAPKLFSWMSDLPADTQQIVLERFNFLLSPDSAEADFNIVMEVSNRALRHQLLERLMHQAKASRAVVLASLEKAQLPEVEKARLAALIPAAEEESDTSEDDDE